ncbi:MAG: ribonuclease protein component [Solirubrobacterales bacterium]|nr:ribonuclease protein component [Solirubrobacterales bacterium]
MEGETPSLSDRPKRAKRGRLSRSAEFERVYRESRSQSNRYLVLYAFPREDENGVRLGLTVSRQVGGAVDRNRVKRLLREAFDAEAAGVPLNHDIVIKARPDVRELAERDGLEAVRRALAELLEKAGLTS